MLKSSQRRPFWCDQHTSNACGVAEIVKEVPIFSSYLWERRNVG